MNSRNRMAALAMCAALIIALVAVKAVGEVTVKLRDLAYIDGFRDNQILGYGLVVGLAGTGDTRSDVLNASISNLLKNLGMDAEEAFRAKNAAAVLITASLPPYARPGDRVDVTVSSINNAKSLAGGILVQSPLKGADNVVYAVAQGPLSAGTGGGKGARTQHSVMTVARVTGGALVERIVEPEYIFRKKKEKDKPEDPSRYMRLVLKHWDFPVANQVIKAIGELYPAAGPYLEKSGKIGMKIPDDVAVTEFITKIEDIDVTPHYNARVVINERDGTIVMGGDVKISEVMVSRDWITVRVEGRENRPQADISGKTKNAVHMRDTASVKDLVDTLNHIGASTKDTIAIIKAMKDAGALHAELIVK